MGAFDFCLPVSGAFISDRVGAELDTELSNTLWVTMKKNVAAGCQNFALPLVRDMHALTQALKENGGHWEHEGQVTPIHYAVLRSEHPDYFSLGGDLNYFRQCIQQRDREALYQYSRLCLDVIYDWAASSNAGTTTIALVQGRALGGGFEAALSADFLIAEEHSQFGFPEIMFGLFPCSGGMTLLARRIGVHAAERMMTNARIYTAVELKDMGVIDEICPRGGGYLAVEKFIANHAKRRAARIMLQRSRHRVSPLDYSELLTVVNEWVELAMKLGDEELRVMEMLIKMQGGGQRSEQRSLQQAA
ncbi:MAG TPA: crotonase/enoyl-CoA hydratase family protein [Burkholderiales bacterium]|jgi:DSF synthase|nr:crotonase/enoyl-CoA hydratase family protein [Burkholderiales bacterium]